MRSPASGGPSGTAGDTPAWLATTRLPLIALPAATKLHRVHRVVHGPIFFGPAIDPTTGVRGPPTYRFDSASGAFGVLYCAAETEGAFVETVMRNPQMRLVSRRYVRLRASTELTCFRDLRLLDLSGRNLAAVGLTNDISTGPYGPCQAWTDYLWSHRDLPDGLAYRSRHNPEQICYAIFERTDIIFTSGTRSLFADMTPRMDILIRSYGKIPTGR